MVACATVPALAAGRAAPQTPAAPRPGASTDAAAEIIAAALTPSPLEANLRHLCDRIGGRLTGSPAMERAVEWAMAALQEAGADRVTREPFRMPRRWEEGVTAAQVLSPLTFSVPAVSVAWSPATSPEGVEAPVRDAGRGTAADMERLGARARGAILLVRQDVMRSLNDLFAEFLTAIPAVRRAADAGAAAIVFTSTRPRQLLYRHQFGFDGPLPLPAAILAREPALRMARLLDAGEEVRLRLSMSNRVGGPFTAHNVVADVHGHGLADEMVLLGAHLDSWDLGTGAFDNGANVAVLIDVVRALAAVQRRPRRTVRVVLFSGEEQGLVGSRAYVRDHLDEMDRISAVVVYDLGNGRIRGYFLGGRPEVQARLETALALLAPWEVSEHPPEAFLGTDNFDFLLQGVPTLVAHQDAERYLPEYHAGSDTLDKIDWRELRLQSAITAGTAFGIADLPERLGRRLSAAEVAELVRAQNLQTQMETFGVWRDYVGGRRGLPPPEGFFDD